MASVGRTIDEDRHVFARWLRRTAEFRRIRITEIRDSLGMDRRRFNRMVNDRPESGRPVLPTEEEVGLIAALLDVDPAVVRRTAAMAAEAMERE